MAYRANITRYLIILALVTITCAVCGYSFYYGDTFFDALYKALQLFNLGGTSPESGQCTIINITRFVAPCITIFGGVQLIYSFSRNGWRNLCLSQFRNHVVVCGYGFTGKSIVRSIKEHKRKVIVIDPIIDEPIISHNELHINKDATDIAVLTEARIKYASEIIIATGDDYINALIYRQALKLNPDKSLSKRVRIEQLKNQNHLKISSDDNFYCFNFSELIINSLPHVETSNIVILGLGSVGNRLVKKYRDKKIIVLEQSDTAIKISKDECDDNKSDIYHIRTDVKGWVQSDLIENLSKYGIDFNTDPIEVFICLGGDWLGFSIAWKWARWKSNKMRINLIGTNIQKELFENIEGKEGINEIKVYNIVDDSLKCNGSIQ